MINMMTFGIVKRYTGLVCFLYIFLPYIPLRMVRYEQVALGAAEFSVFNVVLSRMLTFAFQIIC